MSKIIITASFPEGDRIYSILGAATAAALMEAFGAADVAVEEAPEASVPPPRVDIRFLSPCPPGYDTVLGYLAKHDPIVLELLDRDPDATKRDGYWLMHRARERGLEVVKVEACPWLRQNGIKMVNAYPQSLLAERFRS